MEATSISNEQLDELHKSIDRIFQIVESLGMHRQEVISSKCSVVDKIHFIENLLKEGQLQACRTVSHGTKQEREFVFRHASLSFEEQQVVPNSSQGRDFSYSAFGQSSTKKLSSSMNDDDTKELARYLLVSNGCSICLLDIKQGEGSKHIIKDDDIPLLPKIASLSLIDEQLPVSVGLFSLGSDAYMIGGNKLPTNFESRHTRSGNKNPSNWDVYDSFSLLRKHKGTSDSTYRLSVGDDGTLSSSECDNVLRLKSPKFWPIVEEVDGRIHVFDSAPFACFEADIDWKFSHEVFDCDKIFDLCISKSITTRPLLHDFITSHVVVGCCIFAIIFRKKMKGVFDSTKDKWDWEVLGRIPKGGFCRLAATTVWDILLLGHARCVQEIKLGGNSYYVLFALLCAEGDGMSGSVDAAAYLVTSTGHIICMQELYNFFNGPVKPNTISPGMIIKADKEGMTMCAIIVGVGIWEGGGRLNYGYMFCNTFNVELLPDLASMVEDILNSGFELGYFLDRIRYADGQMVCR